jgi:cell division transport system permease protein
MNKKRGLQFSTLLILAASFSVVAGVLLVGQNLQRVLTLWGESLQMTVYLAENISPEATEELKETLMKDQELEKVQYVSREQALGQFREQMASYAPDLLGDNDLLKLIPPSFQFSLSKNIAPEEQLGAMQTIASRLQVHPGVEEVSYGQDWVKSYSQVTVALRWTGIIFISVILAAALFVISNCLRSSIYQRKEEIEVFELIGATANYIRKPFIAEGMALCLLGSILGLSLSYGFFVVAQNSLKGQLSLLQIAQHIQFLNGTTIFAVIVGSALIGWLSALHCLSSLNNG